MKNRFIARAVAFIISASLSWVAVTVPANAQSVSDEDQVLPCTAEGIMTGLSRRFSSEEMYQNIEYLIVSGQAPKDWLVAAEEQQNRYLSMAHQNNACYGPATFHHYLLQYAGITPDTPLPRTQVEIAAEQAAREAELVAAEAARLQTEVDLDDASERVGNPLVTGSAATAAEADYWAASNRLAEIDGELQKIKSRLATIEQNMLDIDAVNAVIDARFDPESETFFLTEEVMTAMQTAFDEQYVSQESYDRRMQDLNQNMLIQQCRTGTAPEGTDCGDVVERITQPDMSDVPSAMLVWIMMGLMALLLLITSICVFRNWRNADLLPQERAEARMRREEKRRRKNIEDD